MAFDYILLGKKLREARESLLIQPEEAASKLQISTDNYYKLESGQYKVTGDQVVLLASLYQRDFRYFVTGDYPSAESQIQEMFRLNSSLSKNDRIAIQQFVRLCEYESFLEQDIFQKKSKPLPNYATYKFSHSHFKKQGAEAAGFERTRLNLGISIISDIFDLIRSQSIHLFKRQLEDRNISGLYIHHPTAGHCILINYLDDLYRQNFSAAHEYCHALFDSSIGQEVTYFNKNNDGIEWRANNFAGNFLIPQKWIEENIKNINPEDLVNTIISTSEKFKVNSQVVIIRFLEMKLISEELHMQIKNERRLVIKSQEKFDPEIPQNLSTGQKERLTQLISHGLSWYFIELCTEAYRRGGITYHKLLNMLLLPLEQGYEILNDFRTFLRVGGL
ncbi:ImmA/IrrE family metallo-endopeptidase [Tolypothrix sp. FACHB-123]|uniref:helix-turn-helix domain-containing protein n=1 Tax=Tolypothrix sp. FACHB-123 TaxID=2692868 RepID=UPI001683D255|nr:XRE family transcriptional regulator [Tolypothrix sp. FACHB-123]MBD2356882.1 ImmA/IrrE family metallo-endopeptidase [Tolypothrix sp. FACHB-123]